MRTLDNMQPLGLLLLRLGIGIIFIHHGYPKLFVNTHQAMGMFEHLGFPGYFVYISGVIEFFGGIMLIAGLFTRVAALLLAAEMAVAIWRVHLPQGGISAIGNYEFPLSLAVGAFALATLGAGLLSLDHAIYGARSGKSPRKSKSRDRD